MALPTGGSIQVKDVEIKRDAGVLHFATGTFFLYPKIDGMETGAVFQGNGSFDLEPQDATERHSLQTVLKTDKLHLEFSTAVLRFTDGTAQELRKASNGDQPGGTAGNSAANNARELFRARFHYNLDERLLQDVLTEKPGGFFMAEFKTGMLGKQYIYLVDPEGAERVKPDQVALFSSAEMGDIFDISVAFRLADQGAHPERVAMEVSNEAIDTTIAKNGFVTGRTEMKFTAQRDGVRVLPLPLYETLRMGAVYDASGRPLDFIQESKDKDPQFAVILASPLKRGEQSSLVFRYEGKDLVHSEGQGNYYPVGRMSWYPAAGGNLGHFVTYDLTFRVPKDLQVVATGNKVSDTVDGNQLISVWHSKEPLAVAGFSIGMFREKDVPTPDKTLTIQAFANEELPDYLEALKHRSSYLATLNTVSLLNDALNQGSAAFQVYDDYFGPLQYDHVALAQQSACNYGQSWPMLIYLPVCYFFDATTKHILGLDARDPGYWKEVVAHETAHQWWGQTVGFSSYRDQWMSEGFAQWSAGIYLQRTRNNLDDYHEFWRDQKKRAIEKNEMGVRAIDVGPVTMGYRVDSAKVGRDMYQRLIYSKGAYIPHMLELMFFNNKDGNEIFKKTMQDFAATYANRSATTEDFKAIVEKHMPRTMDLDHNGKLDWFFNEWVYGTALPRYSIDSSVTPGDSGDQLHFKVTQSEVTDSFKMLVPLYLETKDGRILRIATLPMTGNTTIDKTVQLPKELNAKRALLNAYEDVLSY
jgi:hypothetical protein